jgi:hypothetical protein
MLLAAALISSSLKAAVACTHMLINDLLSLVYHMRRSYGGCSTQFRVITAT